MTGSPGGEVPETTVRALVTEERLGAVLQPIHPGSLERKLLHPRVQKNGLVLAGHFHGQVPTRVQVLGETEMSFLAGLEDQVRRAALEACFARDLSCVLVTGVPAPGDSPRDGSWSALHEAACATETPLYFSPLRSSVTINLVHAALDDLLAPHTELHGVLVDVYGVGLLLRGKGGIGKSECALELVLKGHRLVADDVVRCDYRPPGVVFGMAAPLLRHHMEIRGLGILNVRELFGVTSVRERKRIDVIVRLVDDSAADAGGSDPAEGEDRPGYDRLGIDDTHESILGVPLRALTLPVRPGRDMGTILEIAARDELLRRAGIFSARRFVSRIERGTLDQRTRAAQPRVPMAPESRPVHELDPRPPRRGDSSRPGENR